MTNVMFFLLRSASGRPRRLKIGGIEPEGGTFLKNFSLNAEA